MLTANGGSYANTMSGMLEYLAQLGHFCLGPPKTVL